MIKVNIDVQSVVGNITGVGKYTKHLVETMDQMSGETNDMDLSMFYFDFKRKGVKIQSEHLRRHAVQWAPGCLFSQSWKYLNFPPYNWLAGSADLYHFPNFIVRPVQKGKCVATIHDLAFIRYPETLESGNLKFLNRSIYETIRRADGIIAVSDYIAGELQQLLNVDPRLIHVIHEGLPPLTQQETTWNTQELRKKFDLPERFLLTVGTIEPRKNHPFLIDIMELLPDDIHLVIVGGLGWKYEPFLKKLHQSPAAKRIHMPGYITDEALQALYHTADLFVYPTIYEGFGFPPLEAMQRGLPVVSAQVGPLPEVLGDAAAWINGFDAREWKEHITHLLNDHAKRTLMQELGHEQVKQYTWEKTVQQTLHVYRKLVP